MTSALQNRLVGTIIVVALVVIFVPEFLDGEKRTNQQTFVDVPEVSQLVDVQLIKPIDTSIIKEQVERPSKIIDEQPVDTEQPKLETELSNTGMPNSEAEQSQVEADVPQTEKLSDLNKPSGQKVVLDDIELDDTGWVVQLGSFQHEKNVRALLNKLNDAGYRVYTRPITNSAGILLTKVFIGPELDRQKLENALPHLFELTSLKGKITPFEVSAN